MSVIKKLTEVVLDASKEAGLQVKSRKGKFMSTRRLQTAAQKITYSWLTNIWECDKAQIFGNYVNKLELHSRVN
jgi:3-deoxy-D-manno-octulosonic acid (KDO) 8-phosphate synthase